MRIDPKKLSKKELRQRKRSTQKMLFVIYAIVLAGIFLLFYQIYTHQIKGYGTIYFMALALIILGITSYLKKIKKELNKRKAYS